MDLNLENMVDFDIIRHDFPAKIHWSSKPDVALHDRRENETLKASRFSSFRHD